jgi:LysR family transcriptional regulator, hydrogen peroxide-inducible genes activator
MEIRQLRYFCAVASTANFTRAAAQERVAQPSLSQQILKLEDELGAKLFDRLGRKARLTQFGETFLPRAQRILSELANATSEIQELAGGTRGTLVLGSIPTITPYFLPSRLEKFIRLCPNIRISVVEDITSILLTQLHEGKIDLALVALPVSGDELVAHEVVREPLYAVVPNQHRLAKKNSISLHEIEHESFLLLKEGHCFRDTAIAACRRAHLRPNVIFESGHFSTILSMVSANMGVSIVPQMAIEKRAGCSYLLIDDERTYRRIGLVQLRSRFQTQSQRSLINCLRQK